MSNTFPGFDQPGHIHPLTVGLDENDNGYYRGVTWLNRGIGGPSGMIPMATWYFPSNGHEISCEAVVLEYDDYDPEFSIIDSDATVEILQDAITKIKLGRNKWAEATDIIYQHGWYHRTACDRLYCEGKLVREDYHITDSAVTPFLNSITENFPEYTDSDLREFNGSIVGVYEPWREPYVNGGVSWYSFNVNEVLSDFNLDSSTTTARHGYDHPQIPGEIDMLNTTWHYGIKFDLTNQTKTLKIPFHEGKWTPDHSVSLPRDARLESYGCFFDSAGTRLPKIDVYFHAEDSDVKDYCTSKSMPYPLPSQDSADFNLATVKPWLWSIVYDHTDSETPIDKIKAYIPKKFL